MNVKVHSIAQRLLNLYRQEHVIIGGWATVNKVFLQESSDEVLEVLKTLPTGGMLVKHIENLKNEITPLDSIDNTLLPYGGAMRQSNTASSLTEQEVSILKQELDNFNSDIESLQHIQSLPFIQRYGSEWSSAIRLQLINKPELLKQWDLVLQTYRAYQLWDIASNILSKPISERSLADIQVEMREYETYLPMFGDTGQQMLNKLRVLISNKK